MHNNNYLNSGHQFTDEDNHQVFKFHVLNYFMTTAVFFGLLIGLLGDAGIMQIGQVQPKADYIFAIFNGLLIWRLRKNKDQYRIVAWLVVTSTYLLILTALIYVPDDELRIAWFYVVAYIAYMLLGTQAGIIFTIAITVSLFVSHNLIDLHISETAIATSLFALLVLSLLARAHARQTARYESILRKKNKQLADNIIELDDALTSARDASKVKSLFLANMSHEIRTPMNGVLSMVQVLQQTQLDPLQHDYLDSIKRSGNTLLALIDDLLDISKIESGTFELKLTDFSTQQFVEDILNTVEPLFDDSDVNFNTHISDNIPPYLQGDENRLKQVIINLVTNASKFTSKGEVALSIDGIKKHDDFFMHIQVDDNGVGIPADKQQHIFDTFQQLSADRISNKGVGLGLSICKRIIDAMNGEISVRSIEGIGSQFSVDLSLNIIEHTRDAPADTAKTFTKKLKVLIAEDDNISRLAVNTMLGLHGHHVDATENGKAAVQQLKKHHYDIILLDIHMPVMNGVEATRTIKQQKLTDAPIIGMTASVMNTEKESYFEAGMDALIEKPINFDQLTQVIVNKFQQHGLPNIKPGDTINLNNTGDRFNGESDVNSASHQIENDGSDNAIDTERD